MTSLSEHPATTLMRATSHNVPVLVLGGYVTVLGTLRCLARAGIPLHCITPMEGYVASSRHHRPPPPGRELLCDVNGLADWLSACDLPEAVLMPCSDEWTRAVAELPADLSGRFPSSIAALPLLHRLLEKSELLGLLDEKGIDHPRTVVLRDPTALGWVAEEPGSTWFLKPSNSQAFRRRFGRKALRVNSLEEAVTRHAECVESGLLMVLQEYVPGPADRHYFVDGFIDRAGELKALLVRRRIRMFPLDFGDSSYIVSVEPEEAEPAVRACERLLVGSGYRGIFSAEFKHDPRDGRFRLLEVNARPWAYVQFAATCGFNAPEMAYRDALGMEVPAVARYARGRTYQFLPNDLYAAMAARRNGGFSMAAWLRASLRAESALFTWDDPLPAVIEGGHVCADTARKLWRERSL